MASASPIDAYLAALPAAQRVALERLRAQVLRLIPDATPTISYGMPAFQRGNQKVIWFAGWKDHCSIYPLTDTFVQAHANELRGYRWAKGTLQLKPERPLPEALVDAFVNARLAISRPTGASRSVAAA